MTKSALPISVPRHATNDTTASPALPTKERNTLQSCRSFPSNTKEQSSHSFPRRAAARERLKPSWSASGKLIRGSRSQPSSLWNPVNSSIFTNRLPEDADTGRGGVHNTNRPLAQSDHGEVTNALKGSLQTPQSYSSLLQVSLSPPISHPKSGQETPTVAPTQSKSHTAPLYTPKMSPTPSVAATSDTPSRRPPTPAKDLEYGIPQRPSQHLQRASSPSAASKRSSLPINPYDVSNLAWNPSHPCYPHPNPHMPLFSPLHETTRIIRIPRDWMIVGDLAQTFSNTYPEILEPWVSEQDFRTLITGINERLILTFSPFGWRAWMDILLGVLTGWIWEDAGLAGVKKGCRDVESFIENWNGRLGLEKGDEEAELVKAVPLRRTGYTCLDIQIPDPHIGMVASRSESKAEAVAEAHPHGHADVEREV